MSACLSTRFVTRRVQVSLAATRGRIRTTMTESLLIRERPSLESGSLRYVLRFGTGNKKREPKPK